MPLSFYFHISLVKSLYRLRFYINVFIYRYVYILYMYSTGGCDRRT